MAVEQQNLDAMARRYVERMTSIRGRRVHRLIMREFSEFDNVLCTVAEDGSPALLALSTAGRVAICRTNGRGPAATIAEWASMSGATVTTSYDLLKDSLPIVSRSVWHTSLQHVVGTLSISAGDLSPGQQDHVAEILRKLGS